VDSQERLRVLDPEAEKLGLFLSAWWDLFGFEWKTAGIVIDAADLYEPGGTMKTEREAFKAALTEVASDGRSGIRGRLVGWFLSRNAGRIADGHKLERKPRDTKSKASVQYRVRRLADVEESS